MMRLSPLTFLLTLLPLAATAQSPMTGEQFDAHTLGRTLYFFSDGEAYGVERYREGQRVTWSFLDGECKEGRWYQDGPFICFVYDGDGAPQCWTFYARGDGLRALFEDQPGATELYEAGEAEEPMLCYGPEVGV
ncbi:hypothetical protein CLV78_102311 [Aliiruegeria haliotis]|uniref:MORN repeat protein n=1 Tax=Aliiruegeria haliotis TaxID=1280846 RepID=A0A2T0RVE9_9RHOB|nr:hypothetical protein [Aliiruegeria haliotis]PRY25134.1 hypothetical protein CLV78_102311 [Aliiruegeria haliotis]